jgi:phage terminase large subunit-like protein
MLAPYLPAIPLLTKEDAKHVTHSVFQIGVEGVSGFTIGFHEVRDALRGQVRVRRKNPPKNIDKLNRAMPWLNWIEDGKVVIVNGPWVKDFVDQVKVFPDGDHDDMVDGVSIAREVLVRRAVPRHA